MYIELIFRDRTLELLSQASFVEMWKNTWRKTKRLISNYDYKQHIAKNTQRVSASARGTATNHVSQQNALQAFFTLKLYWVSITEFVLIFEK